MDGKELFYFAKNIIKVSCLESCRTLLDITMHRVDRPNDIFACITYRFEQWRVELGDLGCSHTHDKVESALFIVRVERIDQGEQLIRLHTRTDLASDRVLNPAEVFDMCFIEVSCPVTDPEHMCRTVIPLSSLCIFACQCLFIVEQQRFM